MRRGETYGLGRFSRRARLLREQGWPASLVPDAAPNPSRGRVAAFDPAAVPPYARKAISALNDAGKQAFLVGGFVRDVLRGARPHDVDIATDALWYQTRDIFIEHGFHVVETGAHHGTVTVFVDHRPVEVTTFRADGSYSDHRRPDSVRYVRDVEEDLARRDFTVNAMAWSPETGIVDPFGGRSDLERRLVRAVGEAGRRFDEDALRIMRGVRFASKLGFDIEEQTSAAIHEHVADLSLVARERIAVEYDGIVCGPGAVGALRAYPDVAACAVPPVAAMVGFDQRSRWHCHDVWEHCLHALGALPDDAAPLVRHVALLHDIGKPATFTVGADGRGHFYGHEEQGARMLRSVLANLRWRKSDIDRACCLVRLHDHRIDPTPRGVRRMLARIGSSFSGAEACACELFGNLLQLKRADTAAHDPSCTSKRLREIDAVEAAFDEVSRSQSAFSLAQLAVGGRDVVAAGVPAGPEVGRILKRLLAQVIDGSLPNDRAALLARIASDAARSG